MAFDNRAVAETPKSDCEKIEKDKTAAPCPLSG